MVEGLRDENPGHAYQMALKDGPGPPMGQHFCDVEWKNSVETDFH
jgi:hypothetical protein